MEIFKRSNIIERSPVKRIERNELGEWMKKIKEGFEKMAERSERIMKKIRREFKEQGRVRKWRK